MFSKIYLVFLVTILSIMIIDFGSDAYFSSYISCNSIFKSKTPIWYSYNPISYNQFDYTVKEFDCLPRLTPRIAKLTYVTNKIMRTQNNVIGIENGNFTPLNLILDGNSNCPTAPTYIYNKNKDFQFIELTKSRIGIKLCRANISNGTGDDARVVSIIKANILEYYPNTKIIILDKDSNCFGDQSGMNICKPFANYGL
ncbi:MAG: hypothetical protein ACRCXZ_08895 [Patescibacteria group bacterium]